MSDCMSSITLLSIFKLKKMKQRRILLVSLMLGLFGFWGCKTTESDLKTVDSVDLERYLGKWHELGRYPNRFQKGCTCSMAEYEIKPDGNIKVTNTCVTDGGKKEAIGTAFVVEGTNNSKLKVQFQWPFKGDYWILQLAPDYSYVVVGSPSRDYLWVLARETSLPQTVMDEIVKEIKLAGFKPEQIVWETTACN